MPPIRYAVSSAYESLVEALEDVSAQANCGVVKKSRPVCACFSVVRPEEAKFDCYLHLKAWNYRGGSSKNAIHILLHAQEQIRLSDEVLIRSSVRVSYFRVQSSLAHLLQNIHFDYAPDQQAHPLFHAQVNNEPLLPPSSEAEHLEFQFEIQPSQPWFNQARIPTSDMSFPSVLLCLAADHFETQFFHDFYRKVCAEQAKMPHPPFALLRQRLSCEPQHFRSSQWFEPPNT